MVPEGWGRGWLSGSGGVGGAGGATSDVGAVGGAGGDGGAGVCWVPAEPAGQAERAVSGVARPAGPEEPGSRGRGPDWSVRAEAMAASAGWDKTMAEPAGRVAALGCSVAQAGPAAPADTAV
ncbi:hypothetical protein MMRN_30910 [Mycobacterium marinum]|nr:hypothetical protein MMRN_30910 [Mycobacterium marinum]